MRHTVLHIFRPNVASLGYALFLAVNAAGVWGGVFPFLPMDFQTYEMLLWFYLAQAASFFIMFIGLGYVAFSHHRPSHTHLTFAASIPYFLGWCALIAAIYISSVSTQLVVVGGFLLGCGSALFCVLWQQLFASSQEIRGLNDLLVGSVYATLIYFGLYLIPRAVTALLIPLVFLPLLALALILKGREIDFEQPMFQDVPQQNRRVYKHVFTTLWRSALCLGAFAFCTGLMRALAIKAPDIGPLVNILSMGALLLTAVGVLLLWRLESLRLNIVKLFQIIFPITITSYAVLFFIQGPYVRWLAAGVYALYSIGLLLMMLQCAQAAQTHGVHPVVVYGVFGGVVYALHDGGFIFGSFTHGMSVLLVDPLALTAVISTWLIALVFFSVTIDFKSSAPHLLRADSIELVSPHPTEVPARPQSVRQISNGSVMHQDRLDKQVYLLQREHRLSNREAEVAGLIVRGNTVARIAEVLFISENTVRTHTKRLYAKLDIHKKQDLVKLVERYDPTVSP